MQLVVKGKNFQVSDHVRKHVEKKMGKLDRFLPSIDETRVELAREKAKSSQDRQIAQVTVRTNGTILRAEERADDILAAIDLVLDKIYRQIARFKGKRQARWHAPETIRTEDMLPVPDEFYDELSEESQRQVVRVKQFVVDHMNEDEAIEQMELLGHDFFLFFNANLGRINLVYRRKDGNYGILDPVLA
ncbi:MAG: ribosome hibernation-promoting factor, HPF/YfiA family [Anaerolineae bacterium]